MDNVDKLKAELSALTNEKNQLTAKMKEQQKGTHSVHPDSKLTNQISTLELQISTIKAKLLRIKTIGR